MAKSVFIGGWPQGYQRAVAPQIGDGGHLAGIRYRRMRWLAVN